MAVGLGAAYGITSVRNKISSTSLEKISVLDSYFLRRYIIIKCRSSSIEGKIHQLLQEL